MYDFLSEKSLRLAIFYDIGGTFILAIWILFTRASKITGRRKYDRDFKQNAVSLCSEPDRTIAKVAENLGIAKDLLYDGAENTTSRRGVNEN